MFVKLSLFVLALALNTLSSPIEKRAYEIDDAGVLNYALTLEHLENAFYSGALRRFDQAAFDAAGLPKGARERFTQIAEHERIHVEVLAGALDGKGVKPCVYTFPYIDPRSFAAISQILEGIGASAYTGAARYIKSGDYLTVAASILSVEARHAAYVASAVNGVQPWSSAFETPIPFSQGYSLAAAFIKICPFDNPPLPFKAFPALAITLSPNSRLATSKYAVKINAKDPDIHYLALLTGLDTKFVNIQRDGSVVLPPGLQGMVFAVVTNSDKVVSDTTTIAGPAVLTFDY